MSERASLIKFTSDPKGPNCFKDSQNPLRDYFNKVIRKDLFLEREGIVEGSYDESENYLDLTEHLYAEDDYIVMTRIPRDQVEFAVKTWRSMGKDTPIIRNEWGDNAYTAEQCIKFFEYCLKESDVVNEYDYIYLIWA